ncbi:MAG TPA: hypothetical protein VJH24_00060 [Candidatus Bilamarchaeaceae archaeon]|nr:hypothetical protein [Candidatus Bilamarchaeaceae archaeon]
MAIKQQQISMPMASAGILGMGADVKISGIQMDPRNIIIATLVFVTLVKIGDILVQGSI